MKNIKLIVIGLIILAVALIFFVSSQNTPHALPPQNNVLPQENAAPNPSFSPQTNTEGEVAVTITPKNMATGAQTWDFAVSLNTHSGALNEDIGLASVLIDENGKEYAAVAWNGDPPGGHHRKGTLSFDPPPPLQKSVTLKMKDVGGIKERIFVWPLQ